MEPVNRRAVHRYIDGEWKIQQDNIANESILDIDIKKGQEIERWLSIIRTPGNDSELVCGLLHNERVLIDCSVKEVSLQSDGNSMLVSLPEGAQYNISPRGRMESGAACGICGRKDLSSLLDVAHECDFSAIPIEPEILLGMPEKMRKVQSGFTSTGGIHAAALFTICGDLILVKEDIGRHNCMDKVIGSALLNNQPLADKVICLSGRIGAELVLKAASSGIPVIVAIGAASSLAIDLARQAGITLYGFAKNKSCVRYHSSA